MTLRDSWDIISSTFNDDILETLYQQVAIHLEKTNHVVVDVRESPINHQRSDPPTGVSNPNPTEIKPADI